MLSNTLLRKLRRMLFPAKRPSSKHGPLSLVASTTSAGALGFELVFRYFDGDGDGKICPSDLTRTIAALSDNEAELVVALMDSDGDGLAGVDDFMRLVDGADEEEIIGDLREAFDMYVIDGGRVITPKSLKRMMKRLGERRSTDECRDMIRRFDLNGDGVLNFDEFLIMMI